MISLRTLILGGAALLCATLASAQTTWALRHQGTAQGDFLWSVTDGIEGAVAVGDGGKILHSTDRGVSWVQRNSGTTLWIVAVTYGNGRYVAVGESGLVLTSSNAITWTQVASVGTTARLNNVLYAQNRFVAVGEGGATIVSLDGGTTWSATTSNAGANWLHGLAFGAGRWIATGQAGTTISSADGINWAKQNSTTTQDLEAVAFAESYSYNYGTYSYTYAYFLAIGANATTQVCFFNTYTPSNGAASTTSYNVYTAAKPATNARFRSLTVGNKVYIATGENGAVYTAPSYYGPWTRVSINTTRNLIGAGFVDGTLMLVGENRTIYQSEPIVTSRLGNISTRGVTGTGGGTMIAGTVVEGFTPKQLLIRGIGPGLQQFGVTGVASDPVLSVYRANGTLIASNTGWSTNANTLAIAAAARAVGAFDLTPAAKDSAMLLTLDPGAYTFQVTNNTGAVGNALVEAYDIDAIGSTTTRTINISTRGQVGTGGNVLIAGLVVKGQSSRTLLVRGVGPALTGFGVPGALADPVVKVMAQDGNATVLATNDNWSDSTLSNGRVVTSDEIQTAAAVSGAFPLAASSKDAALLITLVPGNYTIQVSGLNDTTGVALVEAYDVPNN
jgi:hypothetical protein